MIYLVLFLVQVAVSELVITEFLASNQHGITDDNGDSSDWLEIYSSGSTAEVLDNLYLTDDESALQKWQFPSGGWLVDISLCFVLKRQAPVENYTPISNSLQVESTLP